MVSYMASNTFYMELHAWELEEKFLMTTTDWEKNKKIIRLIIL